MRRVIYFHGLQSKQGGQRVDYLTRKYLTHAPQMTYKTPATWAQVHSTLAKTNPDYIIGSSMGGLISLYSAYNIKCKMLLFNPAIDRIPQYIKQWKCNGTEQQAEIYVVLGKNDQDVNPNKSLDFFGENSLKVDVVWLDIQHKIPYDVFCEQVQRVFGKDQDSGKNEEEK